MSTFAVADASARLWSSACLTHIYVHILIEIQMQVDFTWKSFGRVSTNVRSHYVMASVSFLWRPLLSSVNVGFETSQAWPGVVAVGDVFVDFGRWKPSD